MQIIITNISKTIKLIKSLIPIHSIYVLCIYINILNNDNNNNPIHYHKLHCMVNTIDLKIMTCIILY